jgi:hypothetical protein
LAKFAQEETKYIERVVVGPDRPDRLPSQSELQAQMDFVNRCLSEGRGQLIGTEKGLVVVTNGDQQFVIQHTVYHIAFKRKPVWVEDGPAKPQEARGVPDFVTDKI